MLDWINVFKVNRKIKSRLWPWIKIILSIVLFFVVFYGDIYVHILDGTNLGRIVEALILVVFSFLDYLVCFISVAEMDCLKDRRHSDGILCRNPGEHEIGNALCTAPSDNADKRACGEEDQQHCDDVFVPDALSHEGELFFKRDTAVLQTGDEDRCQKRDDDGDVVEAHRNF